MKVLIVARYFYPEIQPRAFRTTELARELSRQGHEVKVVFPFMGRDYLRIAKDFQLELSDLGSLKWPVVGLKGKGLGMLFRRILRRLLMLFLEYPDLELMFRFRNRLRREGGYDLLISIAVPHTIHWGVAWARTRGHSIATTWVADSGDPFMGLQTDSFRKLFYFRYLEKWFCRKAEFLSIPFEGARDAYYPEFHDKIRIIPQGFRMDKVKIPASTGTREYPSFAYSGSFIPGLRDPRKFLEILLNENMDFRFVLFTRDRDLLNPFRERLGPKLQILDYVPRDQLLMELGNMDFLVNFDNNVGVQMPSKLVDYALTGRPVLNITFDPDLPLIRAFLQGDYTGRMDLPSVSDYDIRNVTRSFVELAINRVQ
jgi:hypothetical protein